MQWDVGEQLLDMPRDLLENVTVRPVKSPSTLYIMYMNIIGCWGRKKSVMNHYCEMYEKRKDKNTQQQHMILYIRG